MKKNLSQIVPFILELNNDTQEISITTAPEILHVTCLPWDHIRTTQHATLYIDNQSVASMQLLALEERLALPPVFRISTKVYFHPGQSYKVSIGVIEPDGTDNPNSSRSQSLIINVLP